MTYQADPENSGRPTDPEGFGYGAKELRALKQYLQTLKSALESADASQQSGLTAETAAREAADTSLETMMHAHHENTVNPHSVTKTQVGLSEIPNAISDSTTEGGSDVVASSEAIKLLKAYVDDYIQNKVHHIGSIFHTEDERTPSQILGFGSWVRIGEGRMLVSKSTDNLSPYFNVGAEGGADTKTLSESEMPAHDHDVTDPGHNHEFTHEVIGAEENGASGTSGFSHENSTDDTSTDITGITVESAGGGQEFSIKNTYRVVNIWRRVS